MKSAVVVRNRGISDFEKYQHHMKQARVALEQLLKREGVGTEWLGWLKLPKPAEIAQINEVAKQIQKKSEVVIVIGIGGSYMGSRAGIDYLFGNYYNTDADTSTLEIYYAGNSFSPSNMAGVLKAIGDRDFSVIYVSKSGGTLEPSVAFKIFYEKLCKKYGDKADRRVYAITDPKTGKLREQALAKKWTMLTIPSDIGGRYSAFTAGTLLPLAVAGCDIAEYIEGADYVLQEATRGDVGLLKHAVYRHMAYGGEHAIECFACFEPRMRSFLEWLKQLFGESEGKDGKGLFPASLVYAADLHSMGQYMQAGPRNMLETIIDVKNPIDATVAEMVDEMVNPNLSDMNTFALEGTIKAHSMGGVPVIELIIEDFSPYSLGYAYMFFMISCAVSGYMLGVNPFDQPGVEHYKAAIKEIMNEQ